MELSFKKDDDGKAKLLSPDKEKRRKGDWTDESKKFYWGKKDDKWIKIEASTKKPVKKSGPKKRDRTKTSSNIKDPKDRAWMDKLLEKRWGDVPEF